MKKCVFIMAIALLSVGAYGRDFVTPAGVDSGNSPDWLNNKGKEMKAENYEWPVDTADFYIPFQAQNICTFKVKMDVGYWIQIDNCRDLVMNLKQIEIHKYTGCVQLKVSTNVDIKLGAFFTKTEANLSFDNNPVFGWAPSDVVAKGAEGQKINLTMTLNKVNLAKLNGGDNCKEIGTITITVKPLVKFNYSFGDKCQPDTADCPPLQ